MLPHITTDIDETAPFERVRATLDELERCIEGELQGVTTDDLKRLSSTLTRSASHAEALHQDLVARSRSLSQAQADAIVRSAEIIEELEQTKLELIEARREAERHQAERLLLLSGVFENAREGVVILDQSAKIQEVNPAFAAITGHDREQLLGQELDSTLCWAFPEYVSAFQSALSGQAWSGRIVVYRKDHGERAYLLSFSPVHRETALPFIIALFSDVTDIDRTQRRLQKQALHDQLTGLPNRRYYRDHLQSLIESGTQEHSRFALCFIDLDDFKSVNDTYGHSTGDELIVEVSRRIQESAGDQSFVSRFGGDEFAILIPNTDRDIRRVATVTDEVLRSVQAPIRLGDIEVRVRASLGIAEFPTDGIDLDELMQHADVAMYEAKKNGRNQIRRFDPKMKQEIDRRNCIQRQLHDALLRNELSVVYQPIVDLQTRELISCEALARWRTPAGESISPAEFIPVAEQYGLIAPLGDAILLSVCRQLADWERQGCRPPRVSVNLSPKQFRSTNFLSRITEIIEVEGVRPEWLTFEVTETAMMDDVDSALRVLDSLRQLGFTLALDDFGTGHSSLSYLQKLNIDTLKIDRTFIVNLSRDEREFAIVESVIRLGQSRGLTVVAEGIETRAQWELLSGMGCDFGQGYYFARPMTAREFACWRSLEFV